jgi:RNA polymerase sigma factor (sigma-70 family)
MDETPDDALVGHALGGDLEAFEDLARKHQQRIYRLVYAMTRDHSDADDLTQEVFLTAFRSLRTFNRRSSFYTWIYRIAVNRTLNFLKKKGRERNRTDFGSFAAVSRRPSNRSLRDSGPRFSSSPARG